MPESLTTAIYLPERFNALEAVGFADTMSLIPGMNLVVVADRPGPVVSDNDAFRMVAEAGVDDVDAAEVLLVGSGRVVPVLDDERTLRWLRRINQTTRFTTSMCVGRALLGAAGLLDGVRVAASAVPLPAYGAVEVPLRLVADGKIITGANTSSSIDLGLHVASQYLDAAAARAVQVVMEYDLDSWGPPFAGRDLPQPGPEEMRAMSELIVDSPRVELMRELFDLAGTTGPV